MPSLARTIDRFQQLVLDRLRRERNQPALRQEIDALIALSEPGERPLTPAQPARLPACAMLDDALVLAQNEAERDIAETIAAIAPALRWTYSYPADPRWPRLAETVAFTQIIGPRGLTPHDRMLMGLTLVAPQTHYPLHSHPAVEFYLVVTGTALWQAGQTEAAARPPGSLILHPSGVPHAMTTKAEPLLAVFTWHGDIASPSVYDGRAGSSFCSLHCR